MVALQRHKYFLKSALSYILSQALSHRRVWAEIICYSVQEMNNYLGQGEQNAMETEVGHYMFTGARILCSLWAISSWINTGKSGLQDFIFCFIRKIDPPASWYHSHPGRLKGHQDNTERGSNLLIAWVFHTDFRITPYVKTESPVTCIPRYSSMPFLTPFLCHPQQLTCFRKIFNPIYLLWQEIASSVHHNYSGRSFSAGEVWWLGWRMEQSCLMLPSLSSLYICHHQQESVIMPQAPFPAKDIINLCQDIFLCHRRFTEWTFNHFLLLISLSITLLIYSDNVFCRLWAWNKHPIWNLRQKQALCPISVKRRQDWGRDSAQEARQEGSQRLRVASELTQLF